MYIVRQSEIKDLKETVNCDEFATYDEAIATLKARYRDTAIEGDPDKIDHAEFSAEHASVTFKDHTRIEWDLINANGKRYKHLGYYNEVGDIRELSLQSADEIVEYWKDGYGAFFTDDRPDYDTDIIPEDETDLIAKGDIRITSDGKYLVYDTSWRGWDKDYEEAEDGDDSDVFIDIFQLRGRK